METPKYIIFGGYQERQQKKEKKKEDDTEKKIMQALKNIKAKNARKNFIDSIKQFWAETMELDWWEQRLNKRD